MLIKQIVAADVASCYQAMAEDSQLKRVEDEFYSLLSKCSEDVYFEMERTVSEYISRVTRIAYLQGIRDFTELFINLKEDTHEILRKYVDV